MDPFGCWGLPATLLALLCCPGSGVNTFQVYIQPEQSVVERGGSEMINCSTSCDKPELGGLETTLSKTLLDEQVQWKSYEVSNISQDANMLCYFTCSGEQVCRAGNVTVFYLPKQVQLTLQPSRVTVGKLFTMKCRVPDATPLEKLTLTLLRGKQPLHNQTFEKGTAVQEAVATHSIMAHAEDGLHNFSCQADLDLRSLGGSVVSQVSKPQALKVYEPVKNNQMVIIITVVSLLLFLFVTSVLLCFVFGQRRRGMYGVQASWRNLRRAYRAQPA